MVHLNSKGEVLSSSPQSIYIPWPFPPVWGVADNTRETTKTMGISLRSSSSDEGPSRVCMALLEQHSPSSPVFHNLRRFIDAISPTAPTTGLPLLGNPVATADANQNCVTVIRHSFLFLARSLASLISILLSFIHREEEIVCDRKYYLFLVQVCYQ